MYVNLIRGTPAFLQIYIAFFGLPLAGVNIDNYTLGVIVMAMNSAAYLCEIFRAGIQSIPKGQSEAARSLGMSAAQTMVSIIIPQTFRNVIPTLTSEFILLYKDTSLLAAVGVMEIVMYAKTIVATTGSITVSYTHLGFTRTRAADEAHALTGRDMQVEVGEHAVALGGVGVGEAEVVEID